MGYEKIKRAFDRLSGLTTDVRNLYRPFVSPHFCRSEAPGTYKQAVPLSEILGTKRDFISVPQLAENILVQVELAGWGLNSHKLKGQSGRLLTVCSSDLSGLPHPALGILIIAKHLHYAGREEFNFAQVEEEYLRFARTKLVGIGKTRWPIGLLRTVSRVRSPCPL
jgi:origin recognition complex subunit 4